MTREWILAALLCVASLAQAAPSDTRPDSQPVQTLRADDVPVALDGATGQLAGWLANFDVQPGTFSYTRQSIDSSDGYRGCRIVFPSAFKSPSPQNNLVPAELYLPKNSAAHSDAKIPGAVVLDILGGNGLIARSLAVGLATRGVAALYFPMAYYGPRKPAGLGRGRWLADGIGQSVDALRQTVMDVRRAKAILAAQPEIDPRRLGITGISLGGIVASLAAGVDGTFDRVVPILAGGDISLLTFTTRETRSFRDKLEAQGIDEAQLEKTLAPVEPLHFASRIDPAKCLMINASNDEVIPRSLTQRLVDAIGGPTVLWLPAGHYSAILYLPTVQMTAASFLLGNKVDSLQYGYFTSAPRHSR